MAKPRVFVSSTYYDLKYVRDALERFLKDQLGYEPVLFERGVIPYQHSQSLSQSCYDEIPSCQILVLIIGGKYGHVDNVDIKNNAVSQIDGINSVTGKEYLRAKELKIPIYTFIPHDVLTEYQTYTRNKENKGINYAQVDNVKIFELIQEIYGQPNNNPIQSFKDTIEIEQFLKAQWAGLFKEYLTNKISTKPIEALENKFERLSDMFEQVIKTISNGSIPSDGPSISSVIGELKKDQFDRDQRVYFAKSDFVQHLIKHHGFVKETLVELFLQSKSFLDFSEKVKQVDKNKPNCWHYSNSSDAELDAIIEERKSVENLLASRK